ncbi:unnamed protein product [Psylliodes chrysocephalus]|uniref:Acyltransferase 3 domain-containing protein n=1 Tax=Psylliodes chrysocephalus TaxID=3402493 RepID=A0A9P0CVX9_9CUCU|nr:unnamed protein product [Psylliodes chrysocephala]
MKIIKMKKYYYSLICFASLFSSGVSHITDKEYGLMPEVFKVDNYDTCMLLEEKAFYCEINVKLAPINPENPPKLWKIIKEYSSSELHYRHDKLRRHICVPTTCPNVKTYNKTHPDLIKELTQCYNDKYRDQELTGTVEIVDCKTAGPIYKIDTVDWSVAIAFLSYLGLVLVLTALDYFKSSDAESYKVFKESKRGKLLVAFSIINNWKKLRSIPSGPDFERLKPVQGLRVYMSIMVVIVHAILAQVAIPVSNPKFLEDMNDSPDLLSNFPKRAVFILSFHFMMSSWMLITSLLVKHDRNEIIDLKFIIKSIIKRYVRFILTIAVVVGFYATWLRHIPYGPFFSVCEESDKCRKNWWANFLFIQNHYDRYYMCHIITWYLSVDMQYYIIGLFLFMIILRKKINIPVTVCFLLIINFIFAFWDHWRHGYSSALSGEPEEIYKVVFNKKAQWHDHFASYHGNAAGYIVGIGFGYVYHKNKDQKIFIGLKKKLAWTILSVCLLGATIVVPQIIDVDATNTLSALWVALTRPLFSLGMGIFVLGLSEGLGGWVKDCLSWSPLYVLGKLSYCVYLCHTVFQTLRIGFMRSPGYISYYTMLDTSASDVLLAFVGALFLSLFFEMPSNELANNMFGTKKIEKKIEKKTN